MVGDSCKSFSESQKVLFSAECMVSEKTPGSQILAQTSYIFQQHHSGIWLTSADTGLMELKIRAAETKALLMLNYFYPKQLKWCFRQHNCDRIEENAAILQDRIQDSNIIPNDLVVNETMQDVHKQLVSPSTRFSQWNANR